MIHDVHFHGLLKIQCATLPAQFANWLMVDCFNAETSELVFLGRGKISVTAQSVADILHLPSNGAEVKYELDVDAINFIHKKYGIVQGSAPKIDEIVKRIENNKDANEDFLRSWLMIAVLTFLCPPTGLEISPRCYPPLVDLSTVKKLNCCQFVVDQLKVAAKKFKTKSSVKGYMLLPVLLYADSLLVQNVQIPDTMPRVAAWSRELLDKVIKLDRRRDGSFGKLKLKPSAHSVVQDSVFQMDDIYSFVSSKASRDLAPEKKRKICEAVRKVLVGVTEVLGTFIQDLAAADDGEPAESSLRRSKRGRTAKHYEQEDEEAEEDSDYEAEEEDFCSSDEGSLGLDSEK